MVKKENISPDQGDIETDVENAESSPKTMKTAFIRVTKVNQTGKDKKIVVTFTEDQIKDILDEWAFTAGIEYWFIDHTPDDDDPNDHFHIVIKFKSPTRFDTVKNKFPYGKIERARSIKKTVQYLVHLNNPEKIQYTWEQVITNCVDLTPFKVLSKSQQEICLQRILEKIENGEITAFNYTDKIPIEIYSKNKTAIKNAIEFTVDKAVSKQQKKLSVMYFYGKPATGKTEFAKKICREKYPGEEPACTSSDNDPLQDYNGQKALIWDDFRDSQFKFVNLLKFLDPHTRSSGKSRYKNKHFLGDLIILTSIQRLDYLYKGTNEDMKQLRRRIEYYYEFVEDKIIIYKYVGNNHFIAYKEHLNPFYGLELKEEPNTELENVYEKMNIVLTEVTTEIPGYLNC